MKIQGNEIHNGKGGRAPSIWVGWSIAMTRWLDRLLLAVLLCLAVCRADAGEFSDLKATIQSRAPAIAELKTAGLIKEGPGGLLVGNDSLDPAQRELLESENADRERMFQILAEYSGQSTDEIRKTFTRMAMAASGHTASTPPANTNSTSSSPSASTARPSQPAGTANDLPAKILTRPFANIYKEPRDGVKVRENVPAFSAYSVSERVPGWYRVSTGGPNGSLGWMKEDDVVEWKQNLVVEFTHPEGREPVLMFNDKTPLKTLIESPKPDRIGQVKALYSTITGGDIPGDFPVRTMEPRRAVKSRDQFYLLPIVDFEETKIDGREGRLLRLAAATRLRGAVQLSNPQDRAQLNQPTDLRSAVARGVQIDLVFVMDLTRSMGPFAERTLQMVNSISQQLGSDEEVMEAMRFGFWGFRDFPEAAPGIEYNTKNYTPDRLQRLPEFAKTLKGVQETKVDSIDYEEDVFAGVAAAVEIPDAAGQNTKWRDGALRLIVLVGDAPGRDPGAVDPECHRPTCPSGTKAGKNADNIRTLMNDNAVYATALYLKAPKWQQYAERGERQFRTMSRNPNSQPGQENFLSIDASNAAQYGDAADALAQEVVKLVLAAQGRGGDALPAANESKSDSVLKTPEAARKLARNMFHGAMVEWLGKKEAATVPRDVLVWASDKDLSNPTVQSLEVKVFLTKNELNDLKLVMDEVLNAGMRGKVSGEDFFQALQAVTVAAARDASQVKNAATLAQTGLIPKFLQGLPYRSTLMDMSNDTWARMSPDAQDQFLHATESKLRYYQDVYSKSDNWQPLNEGDDKGIWVATIPLDQLP
jgi:serine/threonine-protein kinase PpkA